jgi:hypothetical protein
MIACTIPPCIAMKSQYATDFSEFTAFGGGGPGADLDEMYPTEWATSGSNWLAYIVTETQLKDNNATHFAISGKALQLRKNSADALRVLAWTYAQPNISNTDDVELLALMQWDPIASNAQTTGPALRVEDMTDGSLDYVTARIDGGVADNSLMIIESNNDTEGVVASFDTTTLLSTTTKYWVRVRVENDFYKAKYWAQGTPEPDWQATGTDPGHPNGYVGFTGQDASEDSWCYWFSFARGGNTAPGPAG